MFDVGEQPRISVVNKATVPLGFDLAKITGALQVYVRHFLQPVWDCPAHLTPAQDVLPGTWGLVFLDNADQPGALAYHEMAANGYPISLIFVKTTLDAGGLVSVSVSHELAEMLVDPPCTIMVMRNDGITFDSYEVADPVEGDQDGFLVEGFQMSNFVYPSWFEEFRGIGSAQFDHRHQLSAPFTLTANGYRSFFNSKTQQWDQQFGSAQKAEAFKKEDRRMHRLETRMGRMAKPGVVIATPFPYGIQINPEQFLKP